MLYHTHTRARSRAPSSSPAATNRVRISFSKAKADREGYGALRPFAVLFHLLVPHYTPHNYVWLAGDERRSSRAGILRSSSTAENLQDPPTHTSLNKRLRSYTLFLVILYTSYLHSFLVQSRSILDNDIAITIHPHPAGPGLVQWLYRCPPLHTIRNISCLHMLRIDPLLAPSLFSSCAVRRETYSCFASPARHSAAAVSL